MAPSIIADLRKGDIVEVNGVQYRVISLTHDEPGIYTFNLEPA